MDSIRTVACSVILLLWTAGAMAQLVPTPVVPKDICVTDGAATLLPGGGMRIDSASSRGLANGSDGRMAEVRFRYLGPSAETKPLASGELRRQIGLKLRAKDTCNVIYAMWHIEPDTKISVSVKRNPTQHINDECHAAGYETIAPASSIPMSKIAIGETHVFRAILQENTLFLTADEVPVWRGTLSGSINGFDGPSGFRTDNARFELEFLAGAAPPNPAFRCVRGTGD